MTKNTKEVRGSSEVFAERFDSLLPHGAAKRIADRARVTAKTVGQWRRGRSLPSIDVLGVICDELNVSADYLIGRTEHENEVRDLALWEAFDGFMTAMIEVGISRQDRVAVWKTLGLQAGPRGQQRNEEGGRG